jgi:hypothetical protein
MLDWLFRPSCPCDPSAKAWIEERLEWLHEEFPDSVFTGRPIVLPTPEFFPDEYDLTKRAAWKMLDRICGYMDVDSELVNLQVYKLEDKFGTVNERGEATTLVNAGTYQEEDGRFIIRINQNQLRNPMDLVGTFAHELAHARTLGESRAMSDEYDNELLTDLTVVHFGLGIFLANAPRHWAGSDSKWPGTNLRKPEYMSAPMFGWALAHLAWFRGESKPEWAKHLTHSARINLKQGLRYLRETGDSWYKPK